MHEESGHVGVQKLYYEVRKRYDIPYLFDECKLIVNTCGACQKMNKKVKYLPLMPTEKGDKPFRVWAVDLMPNLPTTQ